jgi:uncharacterized protein involved in response to NO
MSSEFWQQIEKDPFRLFFPLGAALALAGILPWAAQYFTHASYPRDLHRVLMIDGFSLAFVCGFLMTAVPRFTGAPHAKKFEIYIIFVCILASGVGAFFSSQSVSFLASAVALVALAVFAARRFLQKTANPPYTFLFIGVGLGLWFISQVLLFLNSAGWSVGVDAVAVAQDLFTNGALMSLVLGVGGRLIPGILGWQEIVSHQRQRYETPEPFMKMVPAAIWLAVFVFVGSYLLKPFLPSSLCLAARALVILYFALKYWAIWKFPATRSFLTWGLWLCCWCMALGFLVPLAWPSLGAHGMHVLFVGGFSLLMLLISTRVSLAHSAMGTGAEKKLARILIFSGLILFAMVTRVTAILWPKIYLDHLGFAAVIWTAGLLVWFFTVFKAMLAHSPKKE